MAKIQDNINRINQAKADIKEAIIAKGVEVSDDVKIDGYAEKIGEIQQGGEGGQFAVDFGQEIATGNPAFIGALQEDIDYYNQIQAERAAYAAGTGGRSDAEILADPEFMEKIAWWPKGMSKNTVKIGACYNLREMDGWVMSDYEIFNKFNPFIHMRKLRIDASASQNRLGYLLYRGSVEDIDVTFSNVTSITTCFYMYVGKTAKVSFPICEGLVKQLFTSVGCLKQLHLETPKVQTLSSCVRECEGLKELYWDISSAKSISYCCYNFKTLEKCHIYGLSATLSLYSHPNITSESVHFILQNANGGTDEAPITLTLHATAKANWEASEYYEEDVARAQELNITIA